MPRKALALVRAALRFAQGATDECGRGQQAAEDLQHCLEGRPGRDGHQRDLHHRREAVRRSGTAALRKPR